MLIISDKDDTLVKTINRRPPDTLEEQVMFDDVIEKTSALRAECLILAIATNQGGSPLSILIVRKPGLWCGPLPKRLARLRTRSAFVIHKARSLAQTGTANSERRIPVCFST